MPTICFQQVPLSSHIARSSSSSKYNAVDLVVSILDQLLHFLFPLYLYILC
jgi:hypothetical protein